LGEKSESLKVSEATQTRCNWKST